MLIKPIIKKKRLISTSLHLPPQRLELVSTSQLHWWVQVKGRDELVLFWEESDEDYG
jgi:hypothetical protein